MSSARAAQADARMKTWAINLPLWWVVPIWVAISVATGFSAPSTPRGVSGGIVTALAATALLLMRHGTRGFGQTMVVIASVAGLAATLLAPAGLAEVVVFIVASRMPRVFSGNALRNLMVLDALAVAGVIGWVSHSVVGALSGFGIPLLVQRAMEHEQLIVERDRAQALLAEVEARRESETQAVALRERGRIARELHDVLAHTLAGLSVQLQAVRAVAAREQVPATVLDPLDTAAALAKSGLEEARTAVGVLRDPIGLGVDEIAALVARHPGPPSFAVSGSGSVSAEAGHAVYRAVQESLTNAARYAPGASVSVSLDWASVLTVIVCDTGLPIGRSAVADQGTGLGLAGMDERLREVGGSVTAGPVAGGGWQVEITVPAS